MEATVINLRSPHLFLTFSAVDHHGHDSVKHVPCFDQWKLATHEEKNRLLCADVRDSSHITAYHFHQRLDLFIQDVVQTKFNVTDWRNRYKW